MVEYSLDPNQSVNKALKVLEYVDAQLGITELKKEEDDEYNAIIRQRSLVNKTAKFYFFVDKLQKKIVGFCMAEQIDRAFRIKYLNENHDTFACDEAAKTESKTLCGINRVWVAAEMRHKRIASRLLDCVCSNFAYVYRLDRDQLAFSDPTPNGRLLAKRYCQNDFFLIYNCVKKQS